MYRISERWLEPSPCPIFSLFFWRKAGKGSNPKKEIARSESYPTRGIIDRRASISVATTRLRPLFLAL